MASQGLFIWLGIAAFAFTANLLICGGELADQSGTFLDDVLALIGFSACDGIPSWVNFAIGLFIIIPAVIILSQVLGPLMAGAFANPVIGTILALASIVSIVSVLIGLLT